MCLLLCFHKSIFLCFFDSCKVISKREDVYRVVKAFASRGEWMNPDAKRFIQHLVWEQTSFLYTDLSVRDFERNGLNLTLSKREEVQRLRTQIDQLSMRYIQNLSEDSTFLLFSEMELVGLLPKFIEYVFIQSLEKVENNKLKITLRGHHVSPLLEYCKVRFSENNAPACPSFALFAESLP
ncbi:hypothetical protein GIB67_000428 [Kingdonia uniflora]|uniref:Uncharacterized protein n=1 Tax=Kingdonia uniflora TaxID=39325 RepID=A0A7J7MQA1_9MAGN|nr:hypothetical protein GIB67_000428 [Kingdonia uniflora]